MIEDETAYMAMSTEEKINFLAEKQKEKQVAVVADDLSNLADEKPVKNIEKVKDVVEKKYQRFDTDEINSMSIRSFLESQGYQRTSGTDASGMYLAQWRGDANPSLKVDYNQNRWYDFGTGKGGTIIDLVKEMHSVEFVEACKMLCQGNIPKNEVQAKPTIKEPPKIQILREKPVSHFALHKYLTQRGIGKATTMQYLKEIEFSVEGKDKPFFGLGFKNDSGGFEIRNEFYKGCSSKDITTIDKKLPTVNVFEGAFDFLSYEDLSKRLPKQYPPANAVILNSTVNLVNKESAVLDFVKKHKEVVCFMDNDQTGKDAYNTLKNKLGDQVSVKDNSATYGNFNDFNEYAAKNHPVSKSLKP